MYMKFNSVEIPKCNEYGTRYGVHIVRFPEFIIPLEKDGLIGIVEAILLRTSGRGFTPGNFALNIAYYDELPVEDSSDIWSQVTTEEWKIKPDMAWLMDYYEAY